jgi:hypothetical protein
VPALGSTPVPESVDDVTPAEPPMTFLPAVMTDISAPVGVSAAATSAQR